MDGKFCWTDLSTNGTFLNSLDARIPRNDQVALNDGDRLFIGEYEIDVSVTSDEVKPAPEPAQAAAPAQAVGAGTEDWFAGSTDDDADELLRPAEPAAAEPEPVAPAQSPEQEFFRPPSTAGGADAIPEDWDLLLSGIMPAQVPEAGAPGQAPSAAPPPQPQQPQPLIPEDPAPVPPAPPTAPTPAAPPASAPRKPTPSNSRPALNSGDAWSQLMAGLELPDQGRSLNPALASREIGATLRALIEGLMEVLAARASTKDEFRLSQTRIGPAMNNPMKFSPTADDALKRNAGRRRQRVSQRPGSRKTVHSRHQGSPGSRCSRACKRD